MPLPTLAEFWRGTAAFTDQPGFFRLLRTVNVGNAAWEQFDITAVTLAGAADGLAQISTNLTNAMIRCVSVLNNSAVAGEDVDIGLNVVGGALTPADAYNTAVVDGYAVELRFPTNPIWQSFYLKAKAGNPVVQLEIWYEVPPAA